jgi:hypothetical protein
MEEESTMVDVSRPVRAPGRPLIRRVTALVGLVFLLVGVAGFIPGITRNLSAITFAGHDSPTKLLGVFQVSVLHNIVHLLYGVVGLLLARTATTARIYLLGGGVIYLILWLYGLVTDKMSNANFVPFNRADDWLHFALGVGMIGLGLFLGRAPASRG